MPRGDEQIHPDSTVFEEWIILKNDTDISRTNWPLIQANEHISRCRLFKARDAVKQLGFPATRRTKKCNHLALYNIWPNEVIESPADISDNKTAIEHNRKVVDRKHRLIRWFRLAGHAPWPHGLDLDDGAPPGLAGR